MTIVEHVRMQVTETVSRLDIMLINLNAFNEGETRSRDLSIAITNIEQGKLWLVQYLQSLPVDVEVTE